MIFDIFDFFDNTKSYSKAISPNSFFKLRKSTSHRFATTEPLNATRHESSTSKIPLPLSLSLIRKSEKKKLTAVSKPFSKTIFPYDTHIGRRIVSDHDRANRAYRIEKLDSILPVRLRILPTPRPKSAREKECE